MSKYLGKIDITSGTIIQGTSQSTFAFPPTAGTAGQYLTSNGPGTNASWTTFNASAGSVTSVGLSVPSFLTASPATITSSGSFSVTYSGTPLPILYGGTGSTTATGTGLPAFQTSPTFITPTLGAAAATTLIASSYIQAQTIIAGLTSTVTAAGTLTLTVTSNTNQVFTGTSTHTIVLPNATTLTNGWEYYFVNQSSISIVIQNAGSSIIYYLLPNSAILITLSSNSTSNGIWSNIGGTSNYNIYSRVGSTGYLYNSFTTGSLGITTSLRVLNKRARAPRATALNAINNWTSRTLIGPGYFPAICWSPELNLFVIGNNVSTANIQTSPDGINWTSRSLGTSITAWEACWSPELSLFVVTNNTSSTSCFQISSNGTAWTTVTLSTSYAVFGVCWSPELGMFAAYCSAGFLTSSNGTSWTLNAYSLTNGGRICWSPELGMFMATNGSTGFYYSTNGTTWSNVGFTTIGNILGICWSPELNLFVATSISASNTTSIATSPDGFNWTARIAPNSNAITSVAWIPEISTFVAVAATTVIMSYDGINWTLGPTVVLSYNIGYSPDLGTIILATNNGVSTYYTSAATRATPKNTLNTWGSSFYTSGSLAVGSTTTLNGQLYASAIDAITAGNAIYLGYYTPKYTSQAAIFTVYNNSTDRSALFNIISAGTGSGTNSINMNTLSYISGTSASNTIGILNVVNNNTTPYYSIGTLAPNMAAASTIFSAIGQSNTAGNSALYNFIYQSNASSSNAAYLSFFGQLPFLYATYGGALTMNGYSLSLSAPGTGVSSILYLNAGLAGSASTANFAQVSFNIVGGGGGTVNSNIYYSYASGYNLFLQNINGSIILNPSTTVTVNGSGNLFQMYNTSITANNQVYWTMGASATTNNSAFMNFYYVGSGSSSNYSQWALFNGNTNITLYPNVMTFAGNAGSDVSPMLIINNINTTPYTSMAVLGTSMSASTNIRSALGQTQSTGNSLLSNFFYAGNNSGSNCYTLGFYGIGGFLSAYNGGNVYLTPPAGYSVIINGTNNLFQMFNPNLSTSSQVYFFLGANTGAYNTAYMNFNYSSGGSGSTSNYTQWALNSGSCITLTGTTTNIVASSEIYLTAPTVLGSSYITATTLVGSTSLYTNFIGVNSGLYLYIDAPYTYLQGNVTYMESSPTAPGIAFGIYGPNMSNNTSISMSVGQTFSTYNMFLMTFGYVSSGSTSNYCNLGFYNEPALMTFSGISGQQITTNYTLFSNGGFYSQNGFTVYGNSGFSGGTLTTTYLTAQNTTYLNSSNPGALIVGGSLSNYNSGNWSSTQDSGLQIGWNSYSGYGSVDFLANQQGGGTISFTFNYCSTAQTSVAKIATIGVSGSYSAVSDYRLKSNDRILDETHIVDNLRPVTYYHKNSQRREIGFIAHEVQELFPTLVTGIKDDPESMQSLEYTGLIPILTVEIQRLKVRIAEQEKLAEYDFGEELTSLKRDFEKTIQAMEIMQHVEFQNMHSKYFTVMIILFLCISLMLFTSFILL
jgi:hypothetical protein